MILKVVNHFLYIILVIDGVYCEVSIREQLEHVIRLRRESQGLDEDISGSVNGRRQMRDGEAHQYRRYDFLLDQTNAREIIGAPSLPSHLPEAEPILPGHTLIRPALGMLKSSIKFPHRELDNGAGVLGNYNNLGLKYDGRNERVLYTGFRRNAPNTRRYSTNPSTQNYRRMLSDYILVVPSSEKSNPSLTITNLVLDLDKEIQARKNVLKKLKSIRIPVKKNDRLIMYVADPSGSPLDITNLFKEKNTDSSDVYSTELVAKYLPDARRDTEIIENDSIEEETEEKDAIQQEKEKEQHGLTKREQFYATKNLFNVIKIHQDMANFEDLVPDLKSHEDNKKMQKDRPWWFFNQVDYTPFDVSEQDG